MVQNDVEVAVTLTAATAAVDPFLALPCATIPLMAPQSLSITPVKFHVFRTTPTLSHWSPQVAVPLIALYLEKPPISSFDPPKHRDYKAPIGL